MAISTELRDFDFFGGQKKDSFKDNLTAIEGKMILSLSFDWQYHSKSPIIAVFDS